MNFWSKPLLLLYSLSDGIRVGGLSTWNSSFLSNSSVEAASLLPPNFVTNSSVEFDAMNIFSPIVKDSRKKRSAKSTTESIDQKLAKGEKKSKSMAYKAGFAEAKGILLAEIARKEAEIARKEVELAHKEKELSNAQQYKIILTVRSRIEFLVRYLFPAGIQRPKSYKESVKIILKSGSPKVHKLLKDVFAKYGEKNQAISIETFATAVEQIFGSASGVGAHNVVDPKILEILRTGSEKTLLEMLALFKVTHDAMFVKALQVISMKLPVPEDSDIFEASLDTYTCVKITSSQSNRMFSCKLAITEADVKEFFPSTVPQSIDFVRDGKENILSIIADFKDVNFAVIAFNENHGWLKRIRVVVEMVERT